MANLKAIETMKVSGNDPKHWITTSASSFGLFCSAIPLVGYPPHEL